MINDEPVFHNIISIPGGINAVIIATHPNATLDIVKQCASMKVKYRYITLSEQAATIKRLLAMLSLEILI